MVIRLICGLCFFPCGSIMRLICQDTVIHVVQTFLGVYSFCGFIVSNQSSSFL